MGTLAPFIIGTLAIAISASYAVAFWKSPRFAHVGAFGLSVALLLSWGMSNIARAFFPLVTDARGTPWAWLLIIPIHVAICISGYMVLKRQHSRWALGLFIIASLMLPVDFWFWGAWFPLRNGPYNLREWELFDLYNETRNFGILAELVCVAIPGGLDAFRALARGSASIWPSPARRRRPF